MGISSCYFSGSGVNFVGAYLLYGYKRCIMMHTFKVFCIYFYKVTWCSAHQPLHWPVSCLMYSKWSLLGGTNCRICRHIPLLTFIFTTPESSTKTLPVKPPQVCTCHYPTGCLSVGWLVVCQWGPGFKVQSVCAFPLKNIAAVDAGQ